MFSELFQLLFNGLVTGTILAIAAVGVSLVYGVLKLVNFAAGDYLTLGAFITFYFSVTRELPFWLAVIFAMLLVALINIAFELTLWRRARRSGAGTLALFLIATGLALIIRHLMLFIFGTSIRSQDVDVLTTYAVLGTRIAKAQVLVVLAGVGAILIIAIFMSRSTIGKKMRAYSDNPTLAAIAGVDVRRVIMATWIISGTTGALAGVLQSVVQSSFESTMGWTLLLSIFAAVVLGTIGDAFGALLGGLMLGIVMELSTWSAFFGGVPTSYKPVVAFAVLILVLLFKPQGIVGYKARSV
jgi:branched-subunit amino acid ABC-type transport system permease component